MSAITSVAATLRRISADDNAAIANVIRQVSAEHGLTADKGYTVADPNLDELFQVYSQPGAAYWVVELNGEVVGGGGVAPLGVANRTFANCKRCTSSQARAVRGWRKSWR